MVTYLNTVYNYIDLLKHVGARNLPVKNISEKNAPPENVRYDT